MEYSNEFFYAHADTESITKTDAFRDNITDSPDSGTSVTKVAMTTQRILACVLCQQRKIKCSRRFPCTNCTKIGTDCVPAKRVEPRERRRRFPERELLLRIRHYEGLLRENSVEFKPLHPGFDGGPSTSSGASKGAVSGEESVDGDASHDVV